MMYMEHKNSNLFFFKHLQMLSFNETASCLDDGLNSGAENMTAVDVLRRRYLGSLLLDAGLQLLDIGMGDCAGPGGFPLEGVAQWA